MALTLPPGLLVDGIWHYSVSGVPIRDVDSFAFKVGRCLEIRADCHVYSKSAHDHFW